MGLVWPRDDGFSFLKELTEALFTITFALHFLLFARVSNKPTVCLSWIMPDVSYHPVETLGFMEGQRKFPNAETRRFGANMVFYTWWLLEIGAATISTLALIALIVVLAKVDQQPQQTSVTGGTQVTINTVVAIISTIVRASLLAMVASALNQSPWNWFSKGADGRNGQPGQPLPDLNTFGDAAGSSLASLKLLYKTRFM